MSKFLYVFLFLAAPFFNSPGHAMDDEWFVDGEYEHQGTVFPRAVCTYKKEKSDGLHKAFSTKNWNFNCCNC